MLLAPITETSDEDIADLPAPRLTDTLDAATLQVVALARRDSLRSARRPSRPDRLLSRLFGLDVAAPLADPRLEALRRYCILARHRDAMAPLLRGELHVAGYTSAQIALIDAGLA